MAEVSVSGSQTRPMFYPVRQLHATMSLPNKKHRISVRVVQPRPFDTISLSRTHPTPSETPTHPNHPMKRFKKRHLTNPSKTSIIQLPHPASTAQTKSPANNTHLQTSKPIIKINATADHPPPRYLSMKIHVIIHCPTLKSPLLQIPHQPHLHPH